MNWLRAKIFFPNGKLTPAFIEQYIARYSVEIDGPQNIGVQWLTLEPSEENRNLCIVFVDNLRLAMFRKASVYDGTLQPVPVYAPPLEQGESAGDREPIGHTIDAYWPENFLADIQRDPQPEPELYKGVQIL